MAYSYRILPGGRRVAAREAAPLVEGSAADVLNAVGTDAAEARRYLEAERASDSPRSTLIAKLERLADDA